MQQIFRTFILKKWGTIPIKLIVSYPLATIVFLFKLKLINITFFS